jgi:CheY-like chemotaxis protein
MPIGIHRKAHTSFTNHKIQLMEDDVFYLFSDGFIDQFGGENGEKFLPKRFKNLLMNIYSKPMVDQHEILEKELEKWKGDRQQLDDVLIMGIRFRTAATIDTISKKQNWQNKRILIVEDTDVNYFLLVEALKHTKVKISRVTNGKEAVDYCKSNDADVILMDINMPVMNGNEAAKTIKSFRTDIPIIAQSAQFSEEEMQYSLQSGCDDYISKPIDMKSFIAKIEKHIFKMNHAGIIKN